MKETILSKAMIDDVQLAKTKLLLFETVTYTRICLMAPYFPNMSYISSAVILYGKFFMYNIRLTSGGSRTYNCHK